METSLKKTALHSNHVSLGAKMVPFAGYEMPVQYSAGITSEHHSVRKEAGLFDVSHMGEFYVDGPDACRFLQFLTTNDVGALTIGQCQYSLLCQTDGGIIDDLLIYRKSKGYMLVVNAARKETDWNWLQEFTGKFEVELKDESEDLGLLALQGPKTQTIIDSMTDLNLDEIPYYHFAEGKIAGVNALISRTGYTGEDGFEFYVDTSSTVILWENLLENGRPHGLKPAGLGSRDSLRLEVGFALYGNDLDQSHTPLESGLNWLVKWSKGDFVGRDSLARQKEEGLPEKLIAVVMDQRGFPRPGYSITSDGVEVGKVTSGTVSPSLGVGIAMGYIPGVLSNSNTELGIMIRGQTIPSTRTKAPFYKDGSVRR